MRVLIVEDNPDIAANVGDYLELIGHSVDFASDGVMGLNIVNTNSFDVIVLDVNLPRMDGFELCKRLKYDLKIPTPVLMLTARDSIEDKVEGFEVGALDYLVKPFELKELELRLQSLHSRRQPDEQRVLIVGDLVLNLDQHTAVRSGRTLSLHRASLTILECLMRAYPNVVARRDLEYLLWGEDAPESAPLRSHMYELRQAIDKEFGYKMLKTVRGIGFSLQAEGGNSGGN